MSRLLLLYLFIFIVSANTQDGGISTYYNAPSSGIGQTSFPRSGSIFWVSASGYLTFWGGIYKANATSDLVTWEDGNWRQSGDADSQGNCVNGPGANPGKRHEAMSWSFTQLPNLGTVFMFGGYGTSCNNTSMDYYLDDFWKYTEDDGRWTKIYGIGPSARVGGATWSDGSNLYLFGGYCGTPSGQYLDDLWQYSIDNGWQQIDTNYQGASVPTGRRDSATWQIGDVVFIFGGQISDGQTTNDMWQFDIKGNYWTQLSDKTPPVYGAVGKISGGYPTPRSGCSTWIGSDGSLTLFGGTDTSKYFNDWWVAQVDSTGKYVWAWIGGSTTPQTQTVLQGTKTQIGARAFAASWNFQGNFLLYGGTGFGTSGNTPDTLGDLWTVNVTLPTLPTNQLSNVLQTALIASLVPIVVICVVVGGAIWMRRKKVSLRREIRKEVEMEAAGAIKSPGAGGVITPALAVSEEKVEPAVAPTSPRAASPNWGKEIVITNIQIETIIGKGNFGEVYLGFWGRRKVALKKLNEVQSQEMAKEVAILESLAHPNIVGYYGIARIGSENYMVMEYANGGSLRSYLHEHTDVAPLDFLEWILDVAFGMEYLSQRNILHKDLALRNLLIASDETGKSTILVSDFGLASSLEEKNYYTKKDDTPLPVKWAAPEALLFNRQTTASDVWSFGIVLWEMYSYGANPYTGMSNRETTDFVVDGGRMKCPQQCPESVFELMLECWNKDEKLRPTFSEIVQRMQAITSEMGGTVKEPQRHLDRPSMEEKRSSRNFYFSIDAVLPVNAKIQEDPYNYDYK